MPHSGSRVRSGRDDRNAGGHTAAVQAAYGLDAGAFYSQLVESAPDAIISKDAQAVITSWNAAATALYGYTPQEAIGQPISLLVPPERQGEEFAILDAVLEGRAVESYETERVAKDGRRLCVSLSVSPIRNGTGEIVGAAAIARDVSERKRLESRLVYLAHHDPVTGLFNRPRFEEELDARLARAARYGKSGAVLTLDLDNFKLINDTFGHAAGDALLRRVAGVLRESVRTADAVGRIGGDEFAVVMSDITPGDAMRAAEKLLTHARCRWHEQTVSVSIGVAPFGARSRVSPHELLIAADVALYEAKTGGRDRLAVYRGPRAGHLSWIKRIREAVAHERLVLHSQPIFDLRDGSRSHEELLVRMFDERGRLLLPASFLPAAERFHLVTDIDRWVIDRSLELAQQGRTVAVNLSALTVTDRTIMEGLEQRLRAGEADPSRLIFEITETAALANLAEAGEASAGLVELGCRFALDDFGAGFVNFEYLKQLPLSYLKIDALFVRNLAVDPVDRHVVEAIVALARAFGHATIAEGVESEAALRSLPALGVDCAQGFHLGQPAPVEPLHPSTPASSN